MDYGSKLGTFEPRPEFNGTNLPMTIMLTPEALSCAAISEGFSAP